MDAHEASQLVLDWHDRHFIPVAEEPLLLGSRPEADLTIDRDFASRHHARIERRKEVFVLIDHSTNGTFVQTEDEQLTFVRRGEIRLWGDGWIALGEPLTPQTAISFRHT
jgi:predicted component of type VI protein secretion system